MHHQSALNLFAIVLLSVLQPRAFAQQSAIDADLVLLGGTIIDGTGAPGTIGDVAIVGDQIVAVGKF